MGGWPWVLPSLIQCHRRLSGDQLTIGQPLGALPPMFGDRTTMSSALAKSCSKGVTTLFACGLINKASGQPWPLSWHF
jgi:hypothetical protein